MVSSIGGNNLSTLLNQIRFIEEDPIRKLESRVSGINNKISLFSDLKSKISSLATLVTALGESSSISIYGKKAATSSDEDVATVTATSSSITTSHTLFVSQLAKADKVISNQYTLTATDLSTTLGAGTYDFNVTVNGTTKQVSVSITAGDDNQTVLDNIVTAVNNTSGLDVSASVLKDSGTTGRLVFTSDNTGEDYEMTISDVTGTLISTSGMDDSVATSGTSGGYVYSTSQLNTKATIDGISVESNSNALSDVVEGLTINLKKTQAVGEQEVSINVTNDTDSIKAKIEEFISAYNSVIDFVRSNSSVNATTYKRSVFSGDLSVTNLQFQLREIVAEPVTGLTSGDPTILASIGIESGTDGKLSVKDSDLLEDKIKNNLTQVSQLFNSSDGYSGHLTTLLDTMKGGTGVIQLRKNLLESQVISINLRIDRMKSSVDKRMDYFRDQYARLQAAFAQFSAQSSYLSQLTGSAFSTGFF